MEVKAVAGKHACIKVAPDLIFEVLAFDGSHDSSSQIDHVAQDRKLFARSRGAHHARENFTVCDSDIAVSVINLVESFDHIEAS